MSEEEYNKLFTKFFNESLCHIKYMVYYSDYFWFIDSVVPNILLVGLVLTILK